MAVSYTHLGRNPRYPRLRSSHWYHRPAILWSWWGLRAWPQTVSYTHLDVYKRQVPIQWGGKRFPGGRESSLFSPLQGKEGKVWQNTFPSKRDSYCYWRRENGRHGLSLFCELLYKQMPIYPMWTRHLMWQDFFISYQSFFCGLSYAVFLLFFSVIKTYIL